MLFRSREEIAKTTARVELLAGQERLAAQLRTAADEIAALRVRIVALQAAEFNVTVLSERDKLTKLEADIAELEAVIAARARAVGAGSIEDKVAAEGGLTQALGRLMAVAEAYPDLKANANFMQLQGELTSTEDIISRARGGYNGAAGGYNQQLVVFPTNVVASMFGFKQMPFFEVENAAERNAPQVKF